MQTDIGVVRERNEDLAYVDAGGRFFVIADGMGGLNGGDVASALAVIAVRQTLDAARGVLSTITASPTQEEREWISTLLERAVRLANDVVLDRSRREPDKHGMGTTLQVVLILGAEAFLVHVGDSRAYLVRDGVARQATVDHTVAQAMVAAGALQPEEAERSPLRCVLCNAVGGSAEIVIDHVTLQLEPGDRLLLCTDGLYDHFDCKELAGLVAAGTGDGALAGLVEEARARGGEDNITGIIISVGADSAVPDELDDAPTIPVAVRVACVPGPFDGLADEVLSTIVEQVLRESSRPHPHPRAESSKD